MVLAGVGVGTGSLALFAASRLYGFIPVDAALAGFLVLAVGTAAIALRGNSQAVAAFGLVAVTAAPPILGASPTLVTVAYLGVALVGTAPDQLRPLMAVAGVARVPHERPPGGELVPRRADDSLRSPGIRRSGRSTPWPPPEAPSQELRRNVHRAKATLLALNALFAIWAIHSSSPKTRPRDRPA